MLEGRRDVDTQDFALCHSVVMSRCYRGATLIAFGGPMHPDMTDAVDELESVSGPTYDEIAERALELCTRRGGADGRDLQDWINLERQARAAIIRSTASAGVISIVRRCTSVPHPSGVR